MVKMTFVKRSNFFIALLLLVALCVACGGDDRGQSAGLEAETNSTDATATDVVTEEDGNAETGASGSEANSATEGVDTSVDTSGADTATDDTTTDMAQLATSENIQDDESGSMLPTVGSISLNKTVFDPQEEIMITVDIVVDEMSDAWVGIIPSDVPHGSEAENDDYDLSYFYVINAADNQGTLNAPLEAGMYDVRLFNTDDGQVGIELDSVSIEVGTVDLEAIGSGMAEGIDTAAENESTTDATDAEQPTDVTADGTDACVVGTWRLENFDAYLVAVIQEAMAETGQDVEVTAESSGDFLLAFDGEVMTASENGFSVTASMMGVSVPTDIDASGSARYTADGTIITGFVDSVNVQETNQGFGINATNLVGEKVMYTCTGDVMMWSDPFPISLEFSRVN